MRLSYKDRPLSDHVIVSVNGEDVTDRCISADEIGEAHCYKRNAEGKLYVDTKTGEAAREVLRGEVAIILKADAPESVKEAYRYIRDRE